MSQDQDVTKLDFDFISTLCHELRSPLFPIIALSDLILKQPDSALDWETLQSHVQMMHRSGHDLLALVEDLHRLSRLETDRVTPKISALSLQDTVTQIHSDLVKTRSGTMLGVSLEFDRDCPKDLILCEQNGLEQIARDLLQVVSTHLPEATPKRLHLSAVDQEICLSFRVPTLAESDRATALMAFWKPPWKISPTGKTNGMKIFIAHHYCRLLGGHCRFSDLGDETAFEFYIPFADFTAKTSQRRAREAVLISNNFAGAYQSLLRARAQGYDLTLLSPTSVKAKELDPAVVVIVDEALAESFDDAPFNSIRQVLPLSPSALRLLDD